ncbi:hypothetical protein Q5741_05185 [Paenibacillus sp. JX-17]|uniref:Uncharacterized protein n=1 Tax=Paenibacillus lacisoli TaxID=3064525 RepID=A0ABT9C971_9BACL|nr:hypothetical protein [Paenibacillus sp. JX-17]MDO7905808.1 hypothetical protein [Paenibacillus sp. JX-17]
MLKGSLRINFWSGLIGFVLTFLVSAASNLLTTSLIRGLIAFAIWFVLAFALRWVLAMTMNEEADASAAMDGNASSRDEQVGTKLNLTTPDESEDLNELLKQKPEVLEGDQNGFAPLNPPKLVSTKDPEELAKAVRHLTDKQGG